MKLGLAQINPTVGNLEGNVSRCCDAIRRASQKGADLIVLPEMVIPGYPPRDILYDPSFVESTLAATRDLAAQVKDCAPALAGSLAHAESALPGHPGLLNAAYLLKDGAAQLAATKRLLPGYDVFFEPRWFLPGRFMPPIKVAGLRIGILICEDMWDEGYPVHPADDLKQAGVDALVCLSDLPYRKGALARRRYHAARHHLPLALVNLVGGNDELVFDGRSFALDEKGSLTANLAAFEEDLQVVEFPAASAIAGEPDEPLEAELFPALVLGLRDFARKNGLERAFLGLSGGVDSSVAAVIAAAALGPRNVTGVAVPSRHTDPRSTESARQLAEQLGLRFETIALEPLHRAAEESLGTLLDGGTTSENVQARLRHTIILMSYVNHYGGFLINTSNKTELTLGYATLYGDMTGAISPLGDLTKPEVYALARWLNREITLIPSFVMERPPTAELKTGQVDPFDYDTLSPELEKLVHANQSNTPMRLSEHKRRQFGIILKVSEKSFGTGRMIPVTRN